MSVLKSLRTEVTHPNTLLDLLAAGIVIAATEVFVRATHQVLGLAYLSPLAAALTANTWPACLGLLVLRVVARGITRVQVRPSEFLHELGFGFYRGIVFGVLPLVAALGFVIGLLRPSVSDHLWVNPLIQILIVILFASVQSRFDDPINVSRVQARLGKFALVPQLWVLTVLLVTTLATLVVGEAGVTWLTPWRTLEASAEPRVALRDIGDGNYVTLVPHSVVRVRTTATRSEIEVVKGTVGFDLGLAHREGTAQTAAFTVRAGGAAITVLPSLDTYQYRRNQFIIEQDDEHTAVWADGPDVRVHGTSLSNPGFFSAWNPSGRLLNQGERAVLDQGRWQVTEPDLWEWNAQFAWPSGYLSFRNTSLEQAVKQVNQFVGQPFVIEDVNIASAPVSGMLTIERPKLAERFVALLERQGLVRQAPASEAFADNGIHLVSYGADPRQYGSVEAQFTKDVCAYYREDERDPYNLLIVGNDLDRQADLNIPGCELATALTALWEQSWFKVEVIAAPTRPTITHPVRGEYSAQEALATMLAGTGCRTQGDALTGIRIDCSTT